MERSQEFTAPAVIRSNIHKLVPVVSRGKGVYLWDTEGHRYLDAASGSVAATLGHAHPRPIEALSSQSQKVTHVYRGTFTSESAELLGQMLIARTRDKNGKVQFANSGSEAVEIALKTAVQYWQERGRPEKTRLVSRLHSYHGNTTGSLSLSGHRGRRSRFESLLHPFPQVKAPDPSDLQSVEDFDRILADGGAETIAAVVIEPIVGAAGPALVPPPGYFQRLREICDEHEVLLIADEVMSGMYRAGEFLYFEAAGVSADITTLGKGLGAGYMPLSAVILSNRVFQAFSLGSQQLDTGGHTYSANPLATAVGVSVLETIDEENLAQNAKDRGEELLAGLEHLQAKHPVIKAAQGVGLLCGLELDNIRIPHASKQLHQAGMTRGLNVYLAGDGEIDGVLITPPIIISSAEVEELLELLDQALNDIRR